MIKRYSKTSPPYSGKLIRGGLLIVIGSVQMGSVAWGQTQNRATLSAVDFYRNAIGKGMQAGQANAAAPIPPAERASTPAKRRQLRASYAKQDPKSEQAAAVAFTLAYQYNDQVALNANRIKAVFSKPEAALGAPR